MPLQQRLPGLRSRPVALVLLGLLLVLAVLSTAQASKNALERSQDFQWSGVRLLLAHIDPWADYLQNDYLHRSIHLSQNPNYLPILYLLLVPLGFLPLVPAEMTWFALNVAFAIASGVLAARFYGLGWRSVSAVVCLLLIATPTRMTFGNGQQGLFVLLLWSVSLLAPRLTDWRSAVAGVSYFKFNFAPPLFLYLLFRGGIRAVLLSAVPSAIATTLIWLWLTRGRDPSELLRLVAEPFAVSRTGYFPNGGDPNLMDVIQAKVLHINLQNPVVPLGVTAITLGAALLVCFTLLYYAVRRHPQSSGQWQMALLATASVGLFKHHFYDTVVLLFPLCHALRLWRSRHAQVALAAIAYLWYLQRAIDATHIALPNLFVFQFAVLMLLLTMTYQLRIFEERTYASVG